jgi:hypothetical protein
VRNICALDICKCLIISSIRTWHTDCRSAGFPKTMNAISACTSLTRRGLVRSLSVLSIFSVLSTGLFAQADPTATDTPAADAPAAPAAPATAAPAATDASGDNGNARMRRGQNRGNFDPAEMQQRLMNNLREQFGVTDDAEWKVISDRITSINELRRASGGGFGGGIAAFRAMQGGNQNGRRGNATVSPEQDALRQAISDKLPDAEIKSRLTRLREVRKANEEKLTKAQEELRGILSVRQEAIAVMFGLLP